MLSLSAVIISMLYLAVTPVVLRQGFFLFAFWVRLSWVGLSIGSPLEQEFSFKLTVLICSALAMPNINHVV